MSRKLFFDLLLSFCVFLVTLAGLGFAYSKLNKRFVIKFVDGSVLTFIKTGDYNPNKPPVQYYPNAIAHFKKIINGEKIYEQVYSLDEFGFRKLNYRDKKEAKEHLIFSGCSFTFGEGIKNEETFAALIEKKYKDLNVYNTGISGGGIHTAIRTFDVVEYQKMAKEEVGKMIYIAIEDHINRWLLSESYLQWAPKHFPYYIIQKREVIYKGSLSDHPLYFSSQKKKLHEIVYKKRTESDLNYYLLGVLELKKRYLAKFPKGRFIFMFHPASLFSDKDIVSITKLLKQNGVEVLDPSELYAEELKLNKTSPKDYLIPIDGHPNARLNKVMVTMLEKLGALKTADQSSK